MNLEFKIGLSLLIVLVLISVIGPNYAPFEPDFSESLRTVVINGEKEYIFAPEFPNKRHPLGTDKDGYDTLTMLLYGAKYTLGACFLIMLIRIVPGLLIGILAGLKKQSTKRLESIGAIPSFLILYFLLAGLTFNTTMGVMKVYLIQVVLIASVGIPSVISSIQNRTWLLTKSVYIEAAKSCGASNFRIAFIHILPHLRGSIFTIMITELISSLNIIGQLAIFNIFLGGTIYTASPPLLHSKTNEWMGIIALTRNSISSKPWMLFIPLTAYLLILFSFNMILQGIEKHYGRKYGKTPFI